MSCSALLTFLFWQGFRASTALAQKCYVPNGDEIPDTPCSPTSSNQASACCSPHHTCLSNGLCLQADMTVNRGSCTDQTWKSSRCAQWCQDVWTGSGVGLFNVKDQLFCCDSNSFNCADGTCYNVTQGSNSPFPVDQGRVIFDRTSGSTSPNDTTATFTSTATLAVSTVLSVTTSTATAAWTCASPRPTVHEGTTVGVAIGVSLGLALSGSVAMLWRQRREARSLRKEKRDWEAKYIALLESRSEPKSETQKSEHVPHHPSERVVRYQLDDVTIGEMPN